MKFWFASPEPVYLAVYVESADTFLVEDVRELVHAKWGEDFLAPGSFRKNQIDVMTVAFGVTSGLWILSKNPLK